MRQGGITFANFVGEDYFRWLQDGLPGYEEVVGDEKAYSDRYLIGVHRRADYEELHGMFIPGNFWYASETWERGETDNAPIWPYAICTTGVDVVKRPRRAATTLDKGSRAKKHKRAASSPGVLGTRGKSSYPVIDSWEKSDMSTETWQWPFDNFDDEEEVRMFKERAHVELLESIPNYFGKFKITEPYKDQDY